MRKSAAVGLLVGLFILSCCAYHCNSLRRRKSAPMMRTIPAMLVMKLIDVTSAVVAPVIIEGVVNRRRRPNVNTSRAAILLNLRFMLGRISFLYI